MPDGKTIRRANGASWNLSFREMLEGANSPHGGGSVGRLAGRTLRAGCCMLVSLTFLRVLVRARGRGELLPHQRGGERYGGLHFGLLAGTNHHAGFLGESPHLIHFLAKRLPVERTPCVTACWAGEGLVAGKWGGPLKRADAKTPQCILGSGT